MNRGGRGEAPDSIARRGVERVEEAVIGADVDPPPPDRCSCVDVGACALGPEQPTARGTEGVEGPVRVPDEDPPIGDRRRGVKELSASEPREGLCPPAQAPRARVDCVDATAVRPEVDDAVREGGRAVDLMISRERPPRLAGVDVDGVKLAIPGAGVERLAHDERGRLEDPCPVAPDDLSRARRHRRDHPGLAPRIPVAGSAHERLHPGVVDDPVGDRRRGR